MPIKQNKENENLKNDESIIHSLEAYLLMFYDNMIDSSELVEAMGDLVQNRSTCQ